MVKTARKNKLTYPIRASDVPVTQRMLYAVRNEMKSNVKTSETRLSAQIYELKALIEKQNSRIEGQDSKFHNMESLIHGISVMIEEQNTKNNVVLEGLAGLFHRQERLENEVARHDKILAGAK